MKTITQEWADKAEEDWEAALDLARRRKKPTNNAVCFQAQQCAEKYLKAWLVVKPFRGSQRQQAFKIRMKKFADSNGRLDCLCD